MAFEHVQTLSRCPGTPWSLQIISCGRCPFARSWPGLRLPIPGSDRWRRVRRPAGQQRIENTAKPSKEIHIKDLREEEAQEAFFFIYFVFWKEVCIWKHFLLPSFSCLSKVLQLSHLLESTTGFHLLLHSLSCWAYCLSTRALSWKHATMSLQAWKASSVRFTVRW